jgi:hypothetical protein
MDVGGRARTILELIVAGDPLDLAGLQVRAHGEREAGHRIGSVDLRILQDGGEGGQPQSLHQ